jgi:hypothetical protein
MGIEAGWPGDGLVLYILELAKHMRHARLARTTGGGFGVGDGVGPGAGRACEARQVGWDKFGLC